MEIVNRTANFKDDTCQRVNSEHSICDVQKADVTLLCDVLEELKKTNDIKNAVTNVRERNLAKKKVLKKEENGGFAIIAGVTVLGTIGLGLLIFMTAKFILVG